MKRCKIPIATANEIGFVAHARAFRMLRHYESFPIEEVLKGAGFAHSFTAQADTSTVRNTVALLEGLKTSGNQLKRWTAFLHFGTVVFAFTDETDAVRARLAI